jgi:hypothetical protein
MDEVRHQKVENFSSAEDKIEIQSFDINFGGTEIRIEI